MVPHALMSKNMRFKEMAKRTLIVQILTGVISVGAALKGFGVYSLVISPILSSIITLYIFGNVIQCIFRSIFLLSRLKRYGNFRRICLLLTF